MNRILFLSVLLLWSCPRLKAQPVPADTVAIEQLIKQADEVGEENVNEAFRLLDEAQEKAREAGHKRLLADALLLETYYRGFTGEYEKMIPQAREAAGIYHHLNLVAEEAKCHNREGIAQMYLNHYSAALRSLFTAKSLTEQTGDKKRIAAANNNIGLVYESLNDWGNALAYAQKAVADKMAIKDTLGLAKSYHNIANLYYYQGKYDSAKAYFRLSDQYSRLSNNEYLQAVLHSDYGNLLAETGELDSAIYHQEQALKFHAPLKEERFYEWCHTVASIGNTWMRKGNLEKASGYLDECKTCEENITDLSYLKGLYGFYSEYYAETGNYAKATHYLQLRNIINDSLLVKSDKLENQRIAIRYEFDQKAREDSLRYQLQLSKHEIAAATYKNGMYLLLVALLLIAGIAVAIIYRVRKMQENKRRQELETVRGNIADDLHDDIASTLSSIQIISSMMMAQSAGNAKMQEAAGTISRLSDKVAGGIREIIWSVNPSNENLEAVAGHLRKIAKETLDAAGIPFVFRKELEDPDIKLLPQVRKDLIMLFKEAVNNARKYSGTTQVDIHIVQEKSYLYLVLKDYGCGFDPGKVKRGNGLANMERRAKNMNAELSVISKDKAGTVIDLKIPLS